MPTITDPAFAAQLRAALAPYLVEPDSHRIELRAGKRLLAYAVRDSYGWALMAREPGDRRSRVRTWARVDPTPGLRPAADRGYVRILLARYGHQAVSV